jgi:hypothetical protein
MNVEILDTKIADGIAVVTLAAGLKLVFQMTLMTIGLYNEPTGAYMPSFLY